METHRRWRTSWLHRDLKINIQQHYYVTKIFIMSESTQTPVRNLQRPPRLQDDIMETHRRWWTSWLHRDLKINIHPHQYVTRPYIISELTFTPVRNLQRASRLQDDKMETHRRWRTSWLHRDLKINIHPHQNVTRPFIISESIFYMDKVQLWLKRQSSQGPNKVFTERGCFFLVLLSEFTLCPLRNLQRKICPSGIVHTVSDSRRPLFSLFLSYLYKRLLQGLK